MPANFKVAGYETAEPGKITLQKGLLQTEIGAQHGERFRRRILSEYCRRHISGKKLSAGENKRRHQQKRQNTQSNALQDKLSHYASNQTFSARRAPMKLNIGCVVTPFSFLDVASR